MTRVSINQPAYFPGESYFYRMLVSDVHIVLDHVQFEKGSYVNRTKINTRQGQQWLTVPVLTQGKGKQAIIDAEVDNTGSWRRKHAAAIEQAYGRLPYYDQGVLFNAFSLFSRSLAETIAESEGVIGLSCPRQVNSHSVDWSGATGSELILNICRFAGADEYISGPNGRDYLNLKAFRDAGVMVRFQEYPENVSALEVLFREGPGAREAILKKGRLLDA